MELDKKINLLKHFQDVYNNEISNTNKITNHELECYIEEYLTNGEYCVKAISKKLNEKLLKTKKVSVTQDTGVPNVYNSYSNNVFGFSYDDSEGEYFHVNFLINETGQEIIITRLTECKEYIKNMILSIEPRAVITIK